MKYYKAFNKDMTCRDFQYKIGETYTLDGELKLCENGFHFCDILNACYNYYPDNKDTIICLVEPLGDVVCNKYDNKLATNKIKIIRQLTKEEIEQDRFLIQDGVEWIGNDCFINCKLLKSIDIPNSVTYIGYNAFSHCTSLESITIPDSVKSIGYCTFYGCESLKEITIPNSVTTIRYHAFKDCRSLKEITIPNSVTTISGWAFWDCTSLKEITIPNSVTYISDCAFCGCESLTIYGYKDSYAEKYAKENNIKFEEINSNKLLKTRINYIDCNWINVKNKCRTTVNKKYTENNPSQTFRENLLISEHSPIRLINIDWSWENIPYWVSTEWSRHKFEKFISSQRNDRVNDIVNRNFKPQNSPVNFDGYANAQNLIDSCRKRLCYCATNEARELAESLKYELFKCNCEVANVLVPNCVYRCGCPEINSCGFWNKFSKELNIETLIDVKNRYNVYNNYFYKKYEKKQ